MSDELVQKPGAEEASSELSYELTYEEAYQELEQILSKLESGDLPLEESLELYEKGATLAAVCSRILDDAELRVQQWQPGGELTPMDDWQTTDSTP